MATWQIRDNQFDLAITHSIAAPGELVYEVLANMEAYPEFISDLVSVTRDGNMYKFVARAAILTIPATVAVTETPGRSVAFEMVEGPLDRLNGAWLVEADSTPGQTRVTLTVHAETDERGEWLLRMTGQYVQNKTGKLLRSFSKRVAELQRGGTSPVSIPQAAARGGIAVWLRRWWARIFARPAGPAPTQPVAPAKPVSALFRDERHIQTLEALASTMLPADDFDQGARNLGFVSVAEMRSRYEAGREQVYTTALDAVDKTAQRMFGKPHFVDLAATEQAALLDAVRQGHVNDEEWGQIKPSAFFGALWEDVVFLYCTYPDTWRRIGFPGPAFDAGGHPDFAQPQQFIGENHGR